MIPNEQLIQEVSAGYNRNRFSSRSEKGQDRAPDCVFWPDLGFWTPKLFGSNDMHIGEVPESPHLEQRRLMRGNSARSTHKWNP